MKATIENDRLHVQSETPEEAATLYEFLDGIGLEGAELGPMHSTREKGKVVECGGWISSNLVPE